MYKELINTVIAERGFFTGFSEEEERLAQSAAADTAKLHDLSGRLDCRERELITIDGETAFDFDDAVGCRRLADGAVALLVAIADVAAYVAPNSVLDGAAYERGNSVYLPDRVLPMLPPALSNVACSLQPQKDRLCVVCEMEVAAGGVRRYRFFRGVMRSAARVNYNEAAEWMLAGGAPFETLPLLAELCTAFRRQRESCGAMILDSPEKVCMVDSAGNLDIADKPRNIAHWAIEEAMIAANRCAADFLIRARRPALHRTHRTPPADNIRRLTAVLAALGMSFPQNPTAADFAAALTAARRRDAALAEVLTPAVLGALSRAEYSPNAEVGHFGLACSRYLHFTSPIRRYPDLLTHRALINALAGAPSPFTVDDLNTVGAHCSASEVSADKAGWDCRARLLCVGAQRFVGCEYDAYVSGISNNGFYVTAGELGVDGFIRLSSLRGYWRYEERAGRLVCGGQTISLGMRVEVKLKSVNPEKGRVDFLLLRGGE